MQMLRKEKNEGSSVEEERDFQTYEEIEDHHDAPHE